MSRSEGLVQRRNVAQSCVPTVADPDNDNEVADPEEADLDSKETRLTLMEEILLLGLKDREVRVIFLPFDIIGSCCYTVCNIIYFCIIVIIALTI